MLLSVVVPCFREEVVLPRLHAALTGALASIDADYEIVLVDDGSDDNTALVIRELAASDAHVRYLILSRNFGKESALRAGLEHARGDAVVIMDADLQHPPALLADMLRRFRDGYDQVVTRRTRRGERRTRRTLSRAYYRGINRLIDVRLEDGVGDFRLLSRRSVDALLELNEANRFSKGLFSWIGFETSVIEYENVQRDSGETSWTFGKLLNYGLDGLMSFNNKPLRATIHLGLVITVLALVYVAWVAGEWLVHGTTAPGYVTLITSVLFLGGIQLVSLGVIGEYIGRIYNETKRRPHYLVKEASEPTSALNPFHAAPFASRHPSGD